MNQHIVLLLIDNEMEINDMAVKNIEKERTEQTEEWLNERWMILNMDDPPRQSDVSYYNGAVKAIEFLGYDWIRYENGEHKVLKH